VNNLRSPLLVVASLELCLSGGYFIPLMEEVVIVSSGYTVIAYEKYFNHIWPKEWEFKKNVRG